MLIHLSFRFVRAALVVVILATLALAAVKPAAAAFPTIAVAAVKANDTVTLVTHDFPSNINFTVRMDTAGNLAIDGIVVGYTNSGIGGSFEVTYKIPAELRDVPTIAIRMESAEGYYTFTWFVNRDTESHTEPGTIPVTGEKPYLDIVGVEANHAVTVVATNFPASTVLTVRVGPFYTFFRDYVIMPSVTSDASGYAKFTIILPEVVEDVEMVTVRLDGGGHYAYNAFKNVDSGSILPITPTGICQVVSVTPGTPVTRGVDFDAVWTIKNISTKTWSSDSVDYKYVSGSKLYEHDSRYDLQQDVKPGETVKVIVDMVAPSTSGFYSTNWALVEGSTTSCSLPLNLRSR